MKRPILSGVSAATAVLTLFCSVTAEAGTVAKVPRVCVAKTVAELALCRRGDQISFAPTTLESVHIPALTARFCDLSKTVVWNTRSFACVAGGERRIIKVADELKTKQ